MALPNLANHVDSTDMTAAKKWREIRSNSRDALLAKNQNESIDVDVSAGGTIVLTVNQREPVQLIRLTGAPGGAYTVEFADGNKQIEIENVSGQSATIDTNTGAASPPVVADSETASLQIRGIEISLVGVVGLQIGALLHSGSISPTAEIDFADNQISQVELKDVSQTVDTPSSSSGTLELNLSDGNVFDVTLTEAVTTLTISGVPVTADTVSAFTLIARQDGTGGWAITFPASVDFPQNLSSKFLLEDSFGSFLLLENGDRLLLEPFLDDGQTLDPDAVDIYVFKTFDAGTTWLATIAGLDLK